MASRPLAGLSIHLELVQGFDVLYFLLPASCFLSTNRNTHRQTTVVRSRAL